MQQQDTTPKGLPRYFIKIGIGLIILPILYMVSTKLLYDDIRAEFGDHNVEMMKYLFDSCLITGLTFILLTRSKVENEATNKARVTGIIGGFLTGVVMVIITPVFDLFGQGPIESIESRQLISFMLIMSMVFRYSVKKGAEKQ